ncbi:protein HEG homolog 1 [Scomber japonicus]|uniref:protein HEG homolog 1 n=1 Tax=Scomber japonicus TaxID=13676 RepID=UPI00230605EA|nr:protein HEG homolog 1 [Scomber japonicus]
MLECTSDSCPLDSKCLNGTCQCLSDTYFSNGRCKKAQVYPGQLHVKSLTFKKEMFNRSSSEFRSTAKKIADVLNGVLKDQPGYIKSEVVTLKPGSVIANVNNIFDTTDVTQESVDETIQKAINTSTNELLASASFSACPSGQRAVGDICQSCPFGYSGFNCKDSALLAVVVISCVLGGVLLILILVLLIYCCWRRCSKSKPDNSSSPYSSGEVNQSWPAGITPIPRATTNWDSAPPIEMTEGGSTHTLVDKKHQTNGLTGSYDLNPDGMKTFKGKNPSRYSYLVQGHENPYFLPGDDGKN